MSSDNKLMIKVLIDLANVDGDIHPYEVKFLKKFINRHFQDHEASELISEITNPKQSYLNSFKQIDSHFLRNHVLNNARVLLNIDNKFTKAEEEAFKLLKKTYEEISRDVIEQRERQVLSTHAAWRILSLQRNILERESF